MIAWTQLETLPAQPFAVVSEMRKHTPGPWHFLDFNGALEVVDSSGVSTPNNSSAVVHWMGFDSSNKPDAEKRCNARLIAKAPELQADLIDMTRQRDEAVAEVERLKRLKLTTVENLEAAQAQVWELQAALQTTLSAADSWCHQAGHSYVAPDLNEARKLLGE